MQRPAHDVAQGAQVVVGQPGDGLGRLGQALKEPLAQDLLKKHPGHLLCPACQKIHDRFAAGVVTLKRDSLRNHR